MIMSSTQPSSYSSPATGTSLGVSIVGYEAALRREMERMATGECKFSVVLSSPRSLAACLHVGLTPEDLRPVSRCEYDECHLFLPRVTSSPKHLSSSSRSPRSSSPTMKMLPPEAQDKIYAHYKTRLFEKVNLIKEQRRQMIMKARGEEGYNFLLLDDDDDEGGTNTAQAHGAGSLDPTALSRTRASPRNIRPHGKGGGEDDKEPHDMEARAAYLKSAMMEMEVRRIEAVKKRQEKEFSRMVEGEKRTILLQQKLLAASEEEMARKKAHEKEVAWHRKIEFQKKQERDREVQRQMEEEQKRRREIARKDGALKDKLTAEARAAERIRRHKAVLREEERRAKLEVLRQRTEEILKDQERRGEAQRREIEAREARVKAQVMAKKEAKANEIQTARNKAEKRIQGALLRNHAIQEAKRKDYQARAAEAAARAEQNHVELLEAAAKAAEGRKAKQAKADERYQCAVQGLQDRIQKTLTRAENRAHFYAKVAAERAQATLLMRVEKELRQKDKEENVKRIQRKEEYEKSCLLARQEADTARYEEIKRERAYLLEQRKATAQETMIRKHRLREAMEEMKIKNRFWVEGVGGDGGEERRKGGKPHETSSVGGGRGRGRERGSKDGGGGRPASAMV
ncbi:hypothetical protein VYU27_006531 [Nannochloropsis oceanica]